MKLLLDTHIWLWSMLDPTRLSGTVIEALASPSNEVWLSPVSTWEAMMLMDLGRLTVHGDARELVDDMIQAIPRREATLTHAVAMRTRVVPLPHRDPADRLLAATAMVYGLTLVTADAQLLRCPGLTVMPNR